MNDMNNMNNMNDLNNNEVNNTPQDNVVTPIVQRRDLADKTIDAVEDFMNTKDHNNEYMAEDIKKNKTFAIISYIPLVCLYFIVTNKYKESNYLKFHVNQGLTITAICIVLEIYSIIISAIFSKGSLVLNSVPTIISIINYILYFLGFLLILFGVANTADGKSKELPVVGKINLLK